MVVEALKVLTAFILFVQNFQRDKAHNMMALMFDSSFKVLICVCEFVD
jgi:hypothetical protein